MALISEAIRIHTKAIVVDAHDDTIVAHKRLGLGLGVRTDKLTSDPLQSVELFHASDSSTADLIKPFFLIASIERYSF